MEDLEIMNIDDILEVDDVDAEEKKDDVEVKQTARQRFKAALVMLGRERPFIRGLASRCNPSFSKKIPTACVMIRGNRKFKMYFNPRFVKEQRYTEHVSGIINHEINHMVRGHLSIDRTGLDVEVLNLTLEVHANMDIPKSWLPPQTEDGEALTHEHFNLPKKLRNWKDIYAELIKKYNKKKKRTKDQKQGLKATGIGKIIKNGGTGHSDTPKTTGKMSKKQKKRVTDPSEVKDMMAKILNKVWNEKVTEKEQKGESPEIKQAEINILKDAVSEIPGLLPGMIRALIPEISSKIRWEQHLRHFVTSIKKRSSSYQKFNKRFPDLMGIVPGRDYRSGRCNLLVCIDTSGSCVGYVPAFIGEVKKLAKHAGGVVLEWDAKEMDAYKLKDAKKKKDFKGGGGTDFRVCLDDDNIKKVANRFNVKRFDGIVFLTDLWAHLPKKPPSIPLMWFVPPCNPDPEKDASFGKFVKIDL